jgi:GTPase
MEILPLVAIVGRPNVGKSSLLNLLVRRPVAITDGTAGTTRDRVEVVVKHSDRRFRVTDTGGMGVVDRDDLSDDVDRQIAHAIYEADLILLVTDVRSGITADLILLVTDVRSGITAGDREAVERLRHVKKPVILVVNKCDTGELESESAEFYGLGFGRPEGLSAKEGFGREELLDRLITELPKKPPKVVNEPVVKLAVVGRRNVGKSTFVNRLVGEDRLITSAIPGTTRDSVDVPFALHGRKLMVIDTAGLRKKRKVHESVEFYSAARTERAIRRADVVFLMIDAATDIGRVDKKLASYIESQHKPVIIVVNKWDLARAKGATPDGYHQYLGTALPGLDYAPMSFMSAKDGFNIDPTMQLVWRLYQQAHLRVPTAAVNRAVQEAVTRRQPPRRGSRTLKVYYATQVDVAPPKFVIFVNDAQMFDRSYIHYLANSLRSQLPFDEVPVKLELKTREHSPSKHARGPIGRTPRHAAARPDRRRPKSRGT